MKKSPAKPHSPAPRDTCPHCGAKVADEAKGCRPLYVEVSMREMSDRARFAVHRLTVDAYALQHPDEYCKSPKTLATHLTGLCWFFEYGGDPAVAAALKRWLSGNPSSIAFLPSPKALKGTLAISDIHGAEKPEEHVDSVKKWAKEVWEAWADHHDQARNWVEEAKTSG
ncbi:MAG: DUF5946 family protein [Methanoregulaceae archaeon]